MASLMSVVRHMLITTRQAIYGLRQVGVGEKSFLELDVPPSTLTAAALGAIPWSREPSRRAREEEAGPRRG